MKKTILIVGLVVAAMMVLGVGVAFAQGPAPYAGSGPMQQNGGGYLHSYMVASVAEKLGMKVEDVEAQMAAGKTMYDIATAAGVEAEDFPALMIDVRSLAVSAAVKAGVITDVQAEWMNSHSFGRGGYGTGNCPMQNGQSTQSTGRAGRLNGNGRGMMGGGLGWQNQQTNP
jgi:hypothetical protein